MAKTNIPKQLVEDMREEVKFLVARERQNVLDNYIKLLGKKIEGIEFNDEFQVYAGREQKLVFVEDLHRIIQEAAVESNG